MTTSIAEAYCPAVIIITSGGCHSIAASAAVLIVSWSAYVIARICVPRPPGCGAVTSGRAPPAAARVTYEPLLDIASAASAPGLGETSAQQSEAPLAASPNQSDRSEPGSTRCSTVDFRPFRACAVAAASSSARSP